MSDGLPKLPGYNFSDPTRTRFSVSSKFDFVNGYSIPLISDTGIGKRELDVNSVGYLKKLDSVRYDPSLTYGRSRSVALPQYMPHFALYANKCLTFKAFFKQPVNESPLEFYRIRFVNIIYFLDDDTFTVMEPTTENAGFVQGRYLKRSKIPKNEAGDCWSWKDLNVGIDLGFYGTVFHTYDCDVFTREYMLSQGIAINPSEDKPHDPYYQARKMATTTKTRITIEPDDKMRRYLEYDGKILKFDCIYEELDSDRIERREHVMYYYLADDTIAVKEVRRRNDGRDPFPLVLKRMKLPKDWKKIPLDHPGCFRELSDADIDEFYQPKDLLVGATIFVLGRRFLIYDCDKFTRHYYRVALNIEQKPAIDVFPPKDPPVQRQIPHHVSGIGSLEDTLGFCFTVCPKMPRVDGMKLLLHANKYLRYLAEMVSTHPEDSIRKFLILYSLSDGTIKMYEPTIRNSGIWGGKYLSRELIPKPNSPPDCPDFYTPVDFYIGAVITIHKRLFRIIGADLYVYRYIIENKDKFTPKIVANMRNYMFNMGYLKAEAHEQLEETLDEMRIAELNKSEEDAEPPSPKEICYQTLKGPDDTGERIPIKPGKFDEEIPKMYRLETERAPQVRTYGIPPPIKDCHYPKGERGKILPPECELVRAAPKIPCCLRKTCPEESQYGTSEQTANAFYAHLSQQQKEVCDNLTLPPCDKEEASEQCHSDKKQGSTKSGRKVVTFADCPNDPCVFNDSDLCRLRVKEPRPICTSYDKA